MEEVNEYQKGLKDEKIQEIIDEVASIITKENQTEAKQYIESKVTSNTDNIKTTQENINNENKQEEIININQTIEINNNQKVNVIEEVQNNTNVQIADSNQKMDCSKSITQGAKNAQSLPTTKSQEEAVQNVEEKTQNGDITTITYQNDSIENLNKEIVAKPAIENSSDIIVAKSREVLKPIEEPIEANYNVEEQLKQLYNKKETDISALNNACSMLFNKTEEEGQMNKYADNKGW